MKIDVVGVVGAGQMGAGIAQVLAQQGIDVILTDVREEALNHAKSIIKKSAEKLAAKGLLEKVTPDQLERFYKNPHIEFISVSVVDIRKISETKLEMDYRIQYLDLNDGAGPTEFTNVKNAELLREGTAWRISLVKGLTTSMAFRDGLLIEIAPKKAAGGSSGGDAQRKVPPQEPSATKP